MNFHKQPSASLGRHASKYHLSTKNLDDKEEDCLIKEPSFKQTFQFSKFKKKNWSEFVCFCFMEDKERGGVDENVVLRDLIEWKHMLNQKEDGRFEKQFRFLMNKGVRVEELQTDKGKQFLSAHRTRIIEISSNTEILKLFMEEHGLYRLIDRIPLRSLKVQELPPEDGGNPSLLFSSDSMKYDIRLMAFSVDEHAALFEGLGTLLEKYGIQS
mmetsp:Transcript_13557/g.17853  ORF Transcript_13557/g.17853 Transcript_13557/m.17853 type:complete len:213 (+) Transcript_13557:10-648(+)